MSHQTRNSRAGDGQPARQHLGLGCHCGTPWTWLPLWKPSTPRPDTPVGDYHSSAAKLSERESIDTFVSQAAAATGTDGAGAAANNGGVDTTDDATPTNNATATNDATITKVAAAAATVVVPEPVGDEDSTPAPVDDKDSIPAPVDDEDSRQQ